MEGTSLIRAKHESYIQLVSGKVILPSLGKDFFTSVCMNLLKGTHIWENKQIFYGQYP